MAETKGIDYIISTLYLDEGCSDAVVDGKDLCTLFDCQSSLYYIAISEGEELSCLLASQNIPGESILIIFVVFTA
jgi:hypothetical protein